MGIWRLSGNRKSLREGGVKRQSIVARGSGRTAIVSIVFVASMFRLGIVFIIRGSVGAISTGSSPTATNV